MDGRLVIEIKLDTMARPWDAAEALRRIAAEIEAGHGNGVARDALASEVGEWEVKA